MFKEQTRVFKIVDQSNRTRLPRAAATAFVRPEDSFFNGLETRCSILLRNTFPQTASHCIESGVPVPPLHARNVRALWSYGNFDVLQLPPRLCATERRTFSLSGSASGMENCANVLVGWIPLALGWNDRHHSPVVHHCAVEFTSRHSDDGRLHPGERLVVSQSSALV